LRSKEAFSFNQTFSDPVSGPILSKPHMKRKSSRQKATRSSGEPAIRFPRHPINLTQPAFECSITQRLKDELRRQPGSGGCLRDFG
jgi:hypothetical protein